MKNDKHSATKHLDRLFGEVERLKEGVALLDAVYMIYILREGNKPVVVPDELCRKLERFFNPDHP